jgi:ParB/RepB/Spo0J family partition protein
MVGVIHLSRGDDTVQQDTPGAPLDADTKLPDPSVPPVSAGAGATPKFTLQTVLITELDLTHRAVVLLDSASGTLDGLLADSIQEVGMLDVPILVRGRAEGGYEILDGLRRARSSRDAGSVSVDVIVMRASDLEVREMAVRECMLRAHRRVRVLPLAWQVSQIAALARAKNPKVTNASLARRLGLSESQMSEALSTARALPEADVLDLAGECGIVPERVCRMGRAPVRTLVAIGDEDERERVLRHALTALAESTAKGADNRILTEAIAAATAGGFLRRAIAWLRRAKEWAFGEARRLRNRIERQGRHALRRALPRSV